MAEKQFIVYDERANPVNGTDDAAVLVCEDTLKRARRCGMAGHVWSYDVKPGTKVDERSGKVVDELINEQYEAPTLELERIERQNGGGK